MPKKKTLKDFDNDVVAWALYESNRELSDNEIIRNERRAYKEQVRVSKSENGGEKKQTPITDFVFSIYSFLFWTVVVIWIIGKCVS
jgi:hypothetical protein